MRPLIALVLPGLVAASSVFAQVAPAAPTAAAAPATSRFKLTLHANDQAAVDRFAHLFSTQGYALQSTTRRTSITSGPDTGRLTQSWSAVASRPAPDDASMNAATAQCNTIAASTGGSCTSELAATTADAR